MSFELQEYITKILEDLDLSLMQQYTDALQSESSKNETLLFIFGVIFAAATACIFKFWIIDNLGECSNMMILGIILCGICAIITAFLFYFFFIELMNYMSRIPDYDGDMVPSYYALIEAMKELIKIRK